MRRGRDGECASEPSNYRQLPDSASLQTVSHVIASMHVAHHDAPMASLFYTGCSIDLLCGLKNFGPVSVM